MPCIYLCMHMYTHTQVHTHTHIHTHLPLDWHSFINRQSRKCNKGLLKMEAFSQLKIILAYVKLAKM